MVTKVLDKVKDGPAVTEHPVVKEAKEGYVDLAEFDRIFAIKKVSEENGIALFKPYCLHHNGKIIAVGDENIWELAALAVQKFAIKTLRGEM